VSGFDIHAYLDAGRRRVDAALDRLLPPETEQPASLHKAMRYSIFAGGKRLRPLLALAAAEAVGAQADAVLDEACSLELLHTYTLIHDDLPAMDNDDLRRGMPTSHKVFGEAVAILAGDALQTLGFEVLAPTGTLNRHSPERLIEVVGMLAGAAGSCGVIGGQVVDIESEGRQVSRETLAYIHANKTGKLIEAAVMLGAILGGAAPDQRLALSRYGQAIGLAFQITDDILDVTSTRESLGKTPGKDARAGKATYPGLLGMAEALRMQQQQLDLSLAALAVFNEKAEPLRHIARVMVHRSN
jgi:geranylgeranyl diphosphate synthase, type II